ncbi:MAG: hypothetical protein ACRDZO_14955 [Egibacteraceae bacterium]
MNEFLDLGPGIPRLTAVLNGDLVAHPFAYSGPSVLAVTGLENMAQQLLGAE